MIKGFTCGCFDLLHAGHIVMLKETKQHCDYLIVGLQTDYERFVQLNAVKYVDEIIPYDTEQSLIDLLESTPIDIRFVGENYKDKSFTGDYLPIDTIYTNRKHSFSTSSLRRKVSNEES